LLSFSPFFSLAHSRMEYVPPAREEYCASQPFWNRVETGTASTIIQEGSRLKDSSAKQAGERIRALREERRMTRATLAAKLEITLNHLYRVETGWRNPTLPIIERAAQVFNVPVSTLLKTEEQEVPVAAEGQKGSPAPPTTANLDILTDPNVKVIFFGNRPLSEAGRRRLARIIQAALDEEDEPDKN
jgi:transcriptional regulator with XRE-family HTH domain